jgi:hypothetical protein
MPPSSFRRFEVRVTEGSAAWWRSSFPFGEDQAIYLDRIARGESHPGTLPS